jgi:hypothetical protein
MLRKFIVRMFLCFAALMCAALLSICIAGYLAFRQPGFYADLRAQEFSASDQAKVKADFQLMESEFLRWRQQSVAFQRTHASPSEAILRRVTSLPEYDPQHDTHSVTITERQINAQLTAAEGQSKHPLRNVRMRLGQNGISMACELVTSKASCVLSVDVVPTLTAEGGMQLDLLSARIGSLRLPMKTLLHWLPLNARDLGSNMRLDLTGPTPCICLDTPTVDPEAPSIRSVTCSEGKITVEFLAPVLKQRTNTNSATPLATDMISAP